MNRCRITSSALLVACAVLSNAASAGQRVPSDVSINLSGKYAYGSLATVHNSIDNIQSIGCQIVSQTGFPNPTATCSALDKNRVAVSCMTSEPQMVHMAEAVGNDSHLHFAWNDNGTCKVITVNHSSLFDTKIP